MKAVPSRPNLRTPGLGLDSPFNLYPAKGRYMWRDLERICEAQGLPFHRPSQFPRSGLFAARVASAAQGERWLPEFIRAVYQATLLTTATLPTGW